MADFDVSPQLLQLVQPDHLLMRKAIVGAFDFHQLEAVILGVPHHQVGEAATAVAEVRSQAPAHATEDGATQAGNKVLNTQDTGNQSFPGDRGPEILPVITTRGGLRGILQT